MSFLRFLWDKALVIFCGLFALSLWTIFAVCAAVAPLVVILTDVCAVAALVVVLVAEYIVLMLRLKRLTRLSETIEEKYLIGETLPRPTSAVEQEYFFLLKCISHAAIDKIEQADFDREEFCEYVETWIHEIKTPLTACSLILANGGDLRRLKAELKKAENLTENILYSARLRSLGKTTQISAFHVKDAVDEAVKSQMELLLAAGIGVETGGDFVVFSDRKVLTFVLKQFLVNCAKYCPHCHITITAKNNAVIFKDDGIGIPAYELPRIFDRGYVGSATKKSGGTGMGLYFSKKLCLSLGIELNARSEFGEFTEFSLVFPQDGSNLTKM